MIIVGAGLSGLIAASMLRGQVSAVVEERPGLPNNHHALLRFRSSVVGDAVGIPFRKVQVMKGVANSQGPIQDAVNYSMKALGQIEQRSISSATGKLEERYIAPPNLVSRLGAQSANIIRYHTGMKYAIEQGERPIVSTIPMPALMEILGWDEKPKFKSQAGTVIRVQLPEKFESYMTVYMPDPKVIPYRASITGRTLIVETAISRLEDPAASECLVAACQALGIADWLDAYKLFNSAEVYETRYAKILPIDEDVRKRFIMWASDEMGIFSLGRFATWRPGLMLDDIVNDVRVIQRLAAKPGTSYAHKLKG